MNVGGFDYDLDEMKCGRWFWVIFKLLCYVMIQENEAKIEFPSLCSEIAQICTILLQYFAMGGLWEM